MSLPLTDPAPRSLEALAAGIAFNNRALRSGYRTNDVAEAIGDLEPKAGRPALLRVGATPFDYLAVVYDAELGKWVGPSFPALAQHEQFSFNPNNGGAFLDANRANVPRIPIPHFKAFYDAGMRLEAWGAGFLQTSSGAQTVTIRLAVSEFEDGDTALSSLTTMGAISHTGNTTQTFKTSTGWQSGTWTPPTDDHAYAFMQRAITSTATGTLDDCGYWLRWVST